MVEILTAIVIVLGFVFMMYQTHRFVRELIRTKQKGDKRTYYTFMSVLVLVWAIYISALIVLILN